MIVTIPTYSTWSQNNETHRGNGSEQTPWHPPAHAMTEANNRKWSFFQLRWVMDVRAPVPSATVSSVMNVLLTVSTWKFIPTIRDVIRICKCKVANAQKHHSISPNILHADDAPII